MSQPSSTPETLVRIAQLITLALVAGAIVFAGIAVVAVGALNEPPSGSIVSLIGAAMTLGQAGLAVFVPDLVVSRTPTQQLQTSAELRPYSLFMTRHIIRLALLEGATFFNIVATIIEHNWWSLGIAGLLVGWMLTQFPTRNRVEAWIARQEPESSE